MPPPVAVSSDREIRRLNSLRGLAALIVVVSHYANQTRFHPSFGSGAGQIGVMLFFLLSGFLMAYLYLDAAPNARNLRNYLVARCARVVPLFYVVVLGSFVLTCFAAPPWNSALYSIASLPGLISHLAFLHGVSVLWTIPPEIQFYLLFALAWLVSTRWKFGVLAIICCVLAADFYFGIAVTTHSLGGIDVGMDILHALPFFASGTLFGYGYRRWRTPAALRSHAWILALLVLPMLYPLIFTWLTGYTHGMWSDPVVWTAMSAVFYAIVFLVPDQNFLLENQFGDFLGKISYSVYLLHAPVLAQFMRFGWAGDNSSFLAFLAVTIVIASISFVLVEAPARRLIRRLSAPRVHNLAARSPS